MTQNHIPVMLNAEERTFNQVRFCYMSLYYFDEKLHEETLRQEGREEGHEEGRKEGFEEGSAKTREEDIRKTIKLLKKKKYSSEEILSDLLEEYPDHADLIKRILAK